MLVSLTVGKVDAGVAVLLTEDKRLIEFPSILLPPDISSGSIVDINVARNFESEQKAAAHFAALQEEIYNTFGINSPSPPVLRCRNATQTSVVLEWDPVSLATAELRSLSLYRNGSKAGNIPRDKLSTKISGLAIDTEYTFHLVLRTSAGTYTSEKLTVRTQKMTDLTGITITPGVMPAELREDLAATVERIGAKLIDTVRIDTTHFVCTEGKGQAWEKALEMNVPVVVPDWVKGCEREGRIVGVRGYYLNADPKLRQAGPGTANQSQSSLSAAQSQQGLDRRPSQLSQQSSQLRVQPPLTSPRIEHTPPTPERTHAEESQTNGDDEPPTPPPKPRTDGPTSAPTPEATSDSRSETPTASDAAKNHVSGKQDGSSKGRIRNFAPTPDVSPRTNLPAKFEQFDQIDDRLEESNGEIEESNGDIEQSNGKVDEGDAKTEESTAKVEENGAKVEENNLKAIGIPHGDEPSKTATPAKEDDGAFDEVDL